MENLDIGKIECSYEDDDSLVFSEEPDPDESDEDSSDEEE